MKTFQHLALIKKGLRLDNSDRIRELVNFSTLP